eukprot:CAMPEP_0113711358 /NCGR_PEP_ID=MMETSP0038_2-20120614/30707_1 /TAXON_ID=2898 /ORGANISM="Cryptomonas paramecium" /LENGTH=161 /DNA_ID=CAMNT_0000637595 /DNA_START=51 /DNA_END=533 /DNA_ORIENTATION=- /assembly_acc=CAM_ASM_000170
MQLKLTQTLRNGALIFLLVNIALYWRWVFLPVSNPAFHSIHVFVVPHSHCDPGWKRNWEQYYHENVRDILRNVVQSLLIDNRRKFSWADISFLAMWLALEGDQLVPLSVNNTSMSWRSAVRSLIKEGRFEIVHGGWVQHDEALVPLESALAQLELGVDYLT